jgi:hypothetical protein
MTSIWRLQLTNMDILHRTGHIISSVITQAQETLFAVLKSQGFSLLLVGLLVGSSERIELRQRNAR